MLRRANCKNYVHTLYVKVMYLTISVSVSFFNTVIHRIDTYHSRVSYMLMYKHKITITGCDYNSHSWPAVSRNMPFKTT